MTRIWAEVTGEDEAYPAWQSRTAFMRIRDVEASAKPGGGSERYGGYALFKFSNYIKLIFQFVWGFWGYRRGEVSFQVFDIFYVPGFSEGRKWRASQRTFCASASFSAGFEEAGMFS